MVLQIIMIADPDGPSKVIYTLIMHQSPRLLCGLPSGHIGFEARILLRYVLQNVLRQYVFTWRIQNSVV